MPLRRIGEALADAARTTARPTKRDWTRLSQRAGAAIWTRKIAELEALRDDLTGCIGCGCLSLRSCRLFNPGDRLAEQGPGPRKLLR